MFLEEKIDRLISEQKRLAAMIELFLPNLETEKGVIHFLEITKNTFNSYLLDGVFEEGVHFTITGGQKRIFLPEAIIKLKKSGVKGRRKTSQTDQEKIDTLQNKLGIISSCRHAG